MSLKALGAPELLAGVLRNNLCGVAIADPVSCGMWLEDRQRWAMGLLSAVSKTRWLSSQAPPEPRYELPGGQRGCFPWTQLP